MRYEHSARIARFESEIRMRSGHGNMYLTQSAVIFAWHSPCLRTVLHLLMRGTSGLRSAVKCRCRRWCRVLPVCGEIRPPGRLTATGTCTKPRISSSIVRRRQAPLIGLRRSDLTVVSRLARLWGNSASWQVDGDRHVHEAAYLKLDCSKAASRLNWHPAIDFDKALQLPVNGYRSFGNKEDMRAVTMAQIDDFLSSDVHAS